MSDVVTAALVFFGVSLWIWPPDGIYHYGVQYLAGFVCMVAGAAIQIREWRKG